MRSPSFTTSFAKASIQIAILMNGPHNIIYGIANIVRFLIKEKRKKGFHRLNLLIYV